MNKANVIDNHIFNCLEGKLLVASPHLDDSFFEKALIYICAHDHNGAVGIMMNHKIGSISAQELAKFTQRQFTQRQIKANNKQFPVLFGGPVYTDKVVVLSVYKQPGKLFKHRQGITLYTDLDIFLQEYAKGRLKSKFIFAKGVAAWEPNQLESEIGESAWFVTSASATTLFSQRAQYKWDNVMKDIGLSNFYHLVCYSGNA